ncbi:indolepyruvate ferredoxin oxidoreductase family protein [Spongorhabdus nitratireducens]
MNDIQEQPSVPARQTADISLDDKYTRQSGRIWINGVQALARLPLDQYRLDQKMGFNTAGFISGYRGSPLGGLDKQLWQARDYLKEHHITFTPGVNEDLGATAVWGSQQVNLFEGARYDGVFGLWYGKGPGVDRSGDVFKHANAAGTSALGGVLAVAGDDHGCKSSTLPHQSDYAFIDAMMPVFYPASVQEVLDFGLYGWALSRYSGCWIGFKVVADVADSSMVVEVRDQLDIKQPREPIPEGKMSIRWPDPPKEQVKRQHEWRLQAAKDFVKANQLDRITHNSQEPKIGILSAGKSWNDVRQVLENLGLGHKECEQLGLRIYKPAMVWPLEPEGAEGFVAGLEEVLVIEEKRPLLESQLKELCYDLPYRPLITGKKDEKGSKQLGSDAELSIDDITRLLARRLLKYASTAAMYTRLKSAAQSVLAETDIPALQRTPHFCSGCPHNTSTKVPEGSRALGGIGCHYMATWMDRNTDTFTHMGGEGASWIGQAPFTETEHVFQNLGDGTYFHSGLLAIRAAQAAGVNITYKILYNDAVAMTGGQSVDGVLDVPSITHQLRAEGIQHIAIVSDDPDKYYGSPDLVDAVTLHHRRELDAVQQKLRDRSGVSVIVYEQTCAAEKRRRRKKGEMHDPQKRVVINSDVCEGCGDCGVQSNCLSVKPLETVHGRKRQIDQSSCNKDFQCVEGFCPSFVTVTGSPLRQPQPVVSNDMQPLPEPEIAACNEPFNIMLTGIGGTGVITVSALLGMAAYLEGKGATLLDQTGLAQKFGAVSSHIRIASSQDAITSLRIPVSQTDLLLGCDMMVATVPEVMSTLDSERSRAIVNDNEAMPAAFLSQPDLAYPASGMESSIKNACGDAAEFIAASRLAESLLGDTIGSNLFMLGYASQKGWLPLKPASIIKAVELNGVAVEFNQQAFVWGRKAAIDYLSVCELAEPQVRDQALPATLEEVIAAEKQHLVRYQDESLAARYEEQVRKVIEAEQRVGPGQQLALAVAQQYSRLLAYKDEYEVARLLSSNEFRESLDKQFEPGFRLYFHLAPPLISRTDPATGRPRKMTFGHWLLPVMKLLAQGKVLRGTIMDPFGYTRDRRLERKLLADYENWLENLDSTLCAENYAQMIELMSLPQQVRGYGPVKHQAAEAIKARQQALLNPLQRRRKDTISYATNRTGNSQSLATH